MNLQILFVSVLILINNSETCIYATLRPSTNSSFYGPPIKKCLHLPYITGTEFAELNIRLINFTARYDENTFESILTISDFPNLKYVHINQLSLGRLPSFINLSKLHGISAYGNTFHKVEKEWFSVTTLEEIFLNNNKIKRIEDGSFGKFINFVELSCNQLTEISAKWFKNSSIVDYIDLHDNKITSLPSGFLRGFTNLTLLNLSHNHIATVGTAALTGPKKMLTLNLAVNKITEISTKAMQNKKHYIKTFDISYNRLNYLEKNFLNKLEVGTFGFYGNPWHCICLRNIEKLMTDKGIIFSRLIHTDDPICIGPKAYTTKCIELVDNDLYDLYSEQVSLPPAPECNYY